MRRCEYRATLWVCVNLEVCGLAQLVWLYGAGFGREGDGSGHEVAQTVDLADLVDGVDPVDSVDGVDNR
jgi:hypothetical protein